MANNRPALPALPGILALAQRAPAFPLDHAERGLLTTARQLYDAGFHGHALLDVWNASVHNLRRRVEAYGVDLFESVVKDQPGRKKYTQDGDTLQERWAGVDDLVLIVGATRLGLLSKKAGKALEMINWMRSHASAAHEATDEVSPEDVVSFALILETNLFRNPLPDPGHSVAALFGPVKAHAAGADELAVFKDQVRTLRPPDLRVCFGFLLDLVCQGASLG